MKYPIASVLLVLTAIRIAGQTSTPTPPAPPKANARPETTPVVAAEPFDKADVPTMASKCVLLDTEAGAIEIELFPESAPESVRNFLNIVSIGALDTTTFSRVVPGFVVQGGNIWTREGGVSAELGKRVRRTIPDEPSKILHERGIVSMARPETPNSATTNFFMLVRDAEHLNGTFSAFGRVTRGMDVVDAITKQTVVDEKPDKPVRIRLAKVTACTPAT